MCFIYVRTEKNKQIVSTSYEKTPVRHAKHNNNVLTAVKSIFDNRRRRRPMKKQCGEKKTLLANSAFFRQICPVFKRQNRFLHYKIWLLLTVKHCQH